MAAFDPVNSSQTAAPGVQQLGLPNPNLVPYPLANSNGTGFLFNRAWLVSFISAASGVVGYNSLRTVFEIEKTAFSTANKGKIGVYNLNDLSRADYLKGALMSLSLGYGGPGAPVVPIFTNAGIWRVHHERKGPDIVSTFESGEGERNLQESTFNTAFPSGTPVTTIINAIIAAMGLVVGAQIGLKPLPYYSGTVFSGSCKNLLDRIIVKELGLRWWVNGYTVVIAPPGTQVVPSAIAVNEQTGLIGTPNLGQGQGGDNVITFTNLINPFLIPGTPVSITSKFLTALGIIKTAKFEGDTHTSKWSVTCECSPLDPKAISGLNTQI